MIEKDYVSEIRTMLKHKYPGFYFKSHGGPYQMEGLPDILGCHRGIWIGIEVKQPHTKKNFEEIQKLRVRQIRHAGGIAFMAATAKEADYLLSRELKRVKGRMVNEFIQTPKKGSKKNTKK